MIDLHVHSTYSDGSLSPADLVERAVEAGLSAMALTDHDTTAGLAPFLAACAERSMIGITGVEISAEVGRGAMHMLGYFIDPENTSLNRALKHIRGGREARNGEILERLREQDCPMAWEEVIAFAGEDVVGRPHFAQAMLARGYVSNKQEAFDRYLGKGQSAYVDRLRMSPADSVAVIRESGGVSVLAHPFTLDLNDEDLLAMVHELAGNGLQGVEVYYPEHSPDQCSRYHAIAQECGLVSTGGTDFHGALNPNVSLGKGFGNLNVPDSVVDELRARQPACRQSART